MKPGDSVLLTKAVAVEGTAIIAREFGNKLMGLGVTENEIEKCRQLLSNISILEEAKIAGRFKGVSAMHDVTEGGLATALEELSIAGKHRIIVDMDMIPVYPQTENICRLLNIDPIGLIGSGSLLICCRKDEAKHLMSRIQGAGIDVTCIGEVLEAGRGIKAMKQEKQASWPCFEVDEITRLF
jgi:hydrogenase maturation factor